MIARVIPLTPKPAYEPMDDPGTCQTPGHESSPARHYPGGWLCDPCIRASRAAYVSSDDEEGQVA